MNPTPDFVHQVKTLLLGDVSLAYYVAAELFALMALAMSLWLHSTTRNPAASSTPVKFSWLFLIMDNIKRIIVGQIALFLIFRFASEALGHELSMWMAAGIGISLSFGLDKFIQFLQSKASITVFDVNRASLTTPPKL